MAGWLGQGVVVANRYEIERLVERGGMGTVYRAFDRESDLHVALKVIGRHFGAPENAERFEREIELLSTLAEPRVVRYLGHGTTAEGQPYLAMQWLDGEDLRAALGRGKLSLNDARRVLLGAAQALAAVHGLGVVHRDLKPGNLFLRGFEIADLVLLDFGLARRVEDSQRLTASGMLLGTPHYMAPEQASSSARIEPATDVFSLGCIFYECLTGRPPFDATNVTAVLARLLFDEPEPVRRRRPAVPVAWAALLTRMLSKDPAHRPRDAAAVLRELASLPPLSEDEALAETQALPALQAASEDSEQTWVCIVLATFAHATPAHASSSHASSPVAEQPGGSRLPDMSSRLSKAHSALARFGFVVEELADGSLIANVSRSEAATDHARIAAKGALHWREIFPDARIAVATGRSLLGQTTRMGEAVDRAARLLERSAPSDSAQDEDAEGVWIDSVTAGLLSAHFRVVSRRRGSLLLGERPDADTDEGRLLLGKPVPCVGRDLELTQLDGLFSRAMEDAAAQAVLVVGPPGTGKSRLRRELLRRIRNEHPDVEPLIGYGDPLTAGSPYGIVSDALRRHAGVRVGDDPVIARQAIAERLCRHVEPEHRARVREFLGELCGIPFPAEESPQLQAARSDPQAMSEQITHAFLDWLAASSRTRPVVLVLEDMQWSDALTVKLLAATLRDTADRPLFVLALARPEVKDAFPELFAERAQEISLRPLSRKASEQLVRGVLGTSIGQETIARIVALADGNALFLEELIRAAAEGQGGDVPETVLAMLQARIARLPIDVRRALRAASIFGETFWQGAVQRICEGWSAGGRVAPALAHLVEAEIIERRRHSRLPEEIEHGFRHALVRDAAYALLGEAERDVGHQLACRYLEEKGETNAVVLAEHARWGGEEARAVVFYARAAEQSLERNDLEEALERSRRGVACGAAGEALGTLRAFESLAAHGLGQWSRSAEAGLEALSLLPRGSVWWCRVAEKQFNVLPTVGQVDRFEELVATIDQVDPHPEARPDYVCAISYLLMMFGLFSARADSQRCLARIEQTDAVIVERDARVRSLFQFSYGIAVRMLEPEPYLTMTLGEESVRASEKTGVVRNLCLPRLLLGLAQVDLGARAEGERTLRSSVDAAKQARDPFHCLGMQVYLGWALAMTPETTPEKAPETAPETTRIAEAEQLALVAVEANVSDALTGIARAILAEVHLSRGQLEQAEAEARKARELFSIMPAYALALLPVPMEVLKRKGQPKEAAEVAREGLALLAKLEGSGWSEVRFRVAAAEAFEAAGEREAARDALREARRQLDLRASKIPDPAWRERYLTERPENARTLELARAWLGSD